MGDTQFREQYLDAVATIITDQSMAGLDIVTDGDSRFDLEVGGKSWFFYVLERLGGFTSRRDTSPGWSGDFGIGPGHILWEVSEAYQPPVVTEKLSGGPLEFSALWKTAQKMTDKPVKFGTISAQSLHRMVWNEHYPSERELVLDLADIMNQELRDLADSGCKLIQMEEPRHHFMSLDPDARDEDFRFFTEAFNRRYGGVNAEIWLHTCWGNPAQQRLFWDAPSYERALPHLPGNRRRRDYLRVRQFRRTRPGDFREVRDGQEDRHRVVNHTNTVIESPQWVVDVVRKALRYIPAERLVISSDCGFGREGISRRIAFHKCVALVQG